MTGLDMILSVGDLRGRRPPIVGVPVLTPRLSSLWLHLVTPVQADVARGLFVGPRTETHARENDIATLVPFEPTPFHEAARTALPARDAA